jgi:hypothetical protein
MSSRGTSFFGQPLSTQSRSEVLDQLCARSPVNQYN